MISLIEALNFRCLKNIRQPLNRFHLLVGANASGKTTFLDVVSFLRDVAEHGAQQAIRARSSNFYDLVWQHGDTGFELAVELELPDDLRDAQLGSHCNTLRYEIAIRLDQSTNQIEVPKEQAFVKSRAQETGTSPVSLRSTVFERTDLANAGYLNSTCLFAKYRDSEGRTHGQVRLGEKVAPSIFTNALGTQGALLASFPATGFIHPISVWLRERLQHQAMSVVLDQISLRRAVPPGVGTGFDENDSNLPWAVASFADKSPERFQAWLDHLGTALPDLCSVTTTERPEDRHRYVSLVYPGGLTVPSWMASDGTLRLLALTLPAYHIEDLRDVYLIEEPENGLHPLAIETMYQSLSSVYESQVLVATHSPLLVSIAKPKDVLCFSKTPEGATEIVAGDQHPNLQDWRGEVDLGTLFASGVLG